VKGPPTTADAALETLVKGQMTGAKPESIAVVTAISGLLARVAYADRNYEGSEQARVREELSMVLGFSDDQIEVVCSALRRNIQALGSGPTRHFTSVLRDQFDAHMCADTVKALLELAIADRALKDSELSLIRRIGHELGVDGALVERLIAHLQTQSQRS
jgi:uncharacterized tellurite resistance protein B-like protein